MEITEIKARLTIQETLHHYNLAPSNKNFTARLATVNCLELENSFVPHYYIKDHLGNIRTEFKEEANESGADISAVVLGEYNYYPFGELIPGEGIDVSENQYLYNGKERQEELGLRYYNYGARFYDPSIGRFIGVDPLADLMPGWSPYSYTFNTPIKYTDPDGRIPVPVVTGAIGAGVGFVVGGAAKAIGSWWKGESVSLKEVGKAAVAGGVSGAIVGSGAALFGGLAATAAVGVASGVAGETTSQGLDMLDGTREVGDFDGEAIAVNGAIAGPLNVVAGGAGKALKGVLSPADDAVRTAQNVAGDQVKKAGGTKAQFQAARKSAKVDTKAAVQKTETNIRAGAQAVSGTVNGSGRSAANSKIENND